MGRGDEGRTSEWNEANLKMKRLHDIQERLNYFKCNPKGILEDRFHYEHILMQLINLYDEGISKYKKSERAICDKFKELLFLSLKECPPFIPINDETMAGKKNGFHFIDSNFNRFMDMLSQFERTVKDYNDAHGLSTKNKESSGLF